MTFGDLKVYDKFKVEKNNKGFVKSGSRDDGAVNAYQLKENGKIDFTKIAVFSKDYEVIKL